MLSSCSCSDQGDDLGQHVRGLDKYMTDDVGKLSLKFFDRAIKFILSSSWRLRDYVCPRHLAVIVLFFSVKLGTGLASGVYYFLPWHHVNPSPTVRLGD